MLVSAALLTLSALGFMNAGGQCAVAQMQRDIGDAALSHTYLRIRRALAFAALMMGSAVFFLMER